MRMRLMVRKTWMSERPVLVESYENENEIYEIDGEKDLIEERTMMRLMVIKLT